jgi:hypothetical protein
MSWEVTAVNTPHPLLIEDPPTPDVVGTPSRLDTPTPV